MTNDDPLIRLLHTADAAAGSPLTPVDLADRVRSRRARQETKSKQIKIGLTAGVAVMLATAALRFCQSPVPSGIKDLPNPASLNSTEIAQLRTEANSLKSQADALENWIAQQQRQARLAELSDERDRQIIAQCGPDPIATAYDRAAGIVVCQGDFMWETFGARGAAESAYRSVVEHFPDSRWAVVAQQSLTRLQMN